MLSPILKRVGCFGLFTGRVISAGYSQFICVFFILSLYSLTYAQETVRPRQLTQPNPPEVVRKGSPRLALVLGNAQYDHAPHLKNSKNDAEDIAKLLTKLGFEVIGGSAQLDQTSNQTKRLIKQFGDRLKQRGGIGLFYYAGHGAQVAGKNYLIPKETEDLTEQTIGDVAVDVGLVLREMEAAGNGFNIVILDACRSNPLTRSWRSPENGLAPVDAPKGTLMAYATAPGNVSNDGTGKNGLYTGELLRIMQIPGLSIEQLFKRVRASVMERSGGRQVPWEASSLIGDFYFNDSGSTVANSIDPLSEETNFWDRIKNSSNPNDFNSYLTIYPNGRFAELARKKTGQNIRLPEPRTISTFASLVGSTWQAESLSVDGLPLFVTFLPDGVVKLRTAKVNSEWQPSNFTWYRTQEFLYIQVFENGDKSKLQTEFKGMVNGNRIEGTGRDVINGSVFTWVMNKVIE